MGSTIFIVERITDLIKLYLISYFLKDNKSHISIGFNLISLLHLYTFLLSLNLLTGTKPIQLDISNANFILTAKNIDILIKKMKPWKVEYDIHYISR
jgi:hypothetical protein